MIQELKNKNFVWHVSVFLLSLSIFTVFSLCYCLGSSNSKYDLREKYSEFNFKYYYPIFQDNSNEAHHALKYTLESGDIALFGSSELSDLKSHFSPHHFFPHHVEKKLRAFGHAGIQEKAISTKLLSVLNENIIENGKVVVLISPSWFLDGEGMNLSLWRKEVASPVILSRIRNNLNVADELKDELLNSKFNSSLLDKLDDLLVQYSDQKFIQKPNNSKNENIDEIDLNWNNLKTEARLLDKKKCTNKLGINDEYYNTYIKSKIETKDFPLVITVKKSPEDNQEIKDLNLLLKILSKLKTKPLIVLLPLNSRAYSNLNQLNSTLEIVKNKIKSSKIELLNLWDRPYEQGVLTDVMHTGSLGWALINEKIRMHFAAQL